jgi:hypothetical protein
LLTMVAFIVVKAALLFVRGKEVLFELWFADARLFC